VTAEELVVIHIGNVFAYLGAIGCWLFCIAYSFRAKWWEKESGTHLFALSFGMAVILTYVSWRIIWPINRILMQDLVIRAAIFGSEAALAYWRLSILFRARSERGQIGNKRQKANRPRGRHSA
jgi:hypothetical protein